MSHAAYLVAAWLCLLTLAAAPASAYDAGAGRKKAEEACAPCHGKGGISEQPAVPSLAGQWNDYVVLALYQFRIGHRPSETMAQFAAPLSDNDLGNIAAYYSSLKPWTPTRQSSAAALAAAPPLAKARNCVQCHGGPGLPGQQSVPRIAGQQIEFVTAQLTAFRAGNRGDIDGNMTSATQGLTDAEIATLADYISGLSTP